jgi:hypothetical protein
MSTVRERHEAEEKRISDLNALFSKHNQKVKTEKPAFDMEAFVDILRPYAEFWVNDPNKYQFKTKSSNPRKQLLELVKFTFATYRVPAQLAKIWEDRIPEPPQTNYAGWQARRRQHAQPAGMNHMSRRRIVADDLAHWYICVAQGGSLYKQYAKKYLTKKEVHTLLTCPHDLSINQIMVYAMAMTFAENEGVALRLARSKLNETAIGEFLKTVIYFFAKNPPKSIEETNDLLDFILTRHREFANIQGHAAFTMSGQTLHGLRRKCQDWHYELRRIKDMGTYEWEGAPIPDEVIEMKNGEGNTVKWHFTQIKTSKALAAEGTAMRHCVYSYRDRCVRHEVYIFSLSSQSVYGAMITKKVTLELRNDGSIVQARGVANRIMKAEERHIVKTWASRNGLYLAC